MTNHHAGSATGIDLAALEQLARKAKDGDYKATEALNDAANPATVLALIALARATPQHPEAKPLAWMVGDELYNSYDEIPDTHLPPYWYPTALIAAAPADAATTQHSVTEQASIDTPEFRSMMIDYRGAGTRESAMRGLKCIISHIDSRAQPPASTAATQKGKSFSPEMIAAVQARLEAAGYKKVGDTAATQPEQASIANRIVQDVCELDYTGEDWDAEKMLSVTVDDLRLIVDQHCAALAIPASTAPIQHEAECKRCSGHAMICVDGLTTTPCPDCQDLSDYDDSIPASTAASPIGQYMESSIALDTATDNFYGQGISPSTAASEQQASVSEADRIGNTDHVGRNLDGMPQPYAGSIVLLETIAECGARAFVGDERTEMSKLCTRFANELREAGRATIPSDADERAIVPAGIAKLLHNLREEGVLSEGQITQALDVDRLTCREILDGALTHRATTASEEIGCGGTGKFNDEMPCLGCDACPREGATTAADQQGDPMDWPLPCDVKVGAGTIRKGCKLRTLVTRMESLHRMAMAATPEPTPEARAAIESLLGSPHVDQQGDTASASFADWLAREMPAGTVIGDPAWWAPRILRAAQQGAAQAQAGELWSYKKRGGRYEMVGTAKAAGALKDVLITNEFTVYRAVDGGALYVRIPADFNESMERIDRAAMAAPTTSTGGKA